DGDSSGESDENLSGEAEGAGVLGQPSIAGKTRRGRKGSGPRHQLPGRKGGDGGLSGAQRGGQVDDDQDAHGDPASHLRPVGGARDGAAEGKGPFVLPHRDGLRTKVAALV